MKTIEAGRRPGAGLLAMLMVMMTAVSGIVAGVVSAPAAQAATTGDIRQITTENGAVFSYSVVFDGTGHGTTDQCLINSANGFTPGDNDPHDGYVCSGDSVMYRLAWAFPATATQATYTVEFSSPAPTLGSITPELSTSTQAQWCTNDPAGKYKAALTRNDDSGVTCTFTVSAGVSLSGGADILRTVPQDWSQSLDIMPYGLTTTYANTLSVTQGGGAKQTQSFDQITQLRVFTADPYVVRSPQTAVKINGQYYFQEQISIQFGEWKTSPWGSSWSQTKGWGRNRIGGRGTFVATVDLTQFPAGTIFKDPGQWDSVTYDAGRTTATMTVGPSKTPRFFVYIPMITNGTQTYTTHITSGTWTTRAPGSLFDMNQGLLPDPGLGEPSTFSTAPLTGYDKGTWAANNDWATASLTNTMGNLLTKTTVEDVAGKPGRAYRPTLPQNANFWTTLSLRPFAGTVPSASMCDTWQTTPSTSSANGPTMYDPSRTLSVYQWSDTGTKSTMVEGTDYVVEFSSKGCTDSKATWTSAPDGQNTASVRVRFLAQPLDLFSSNIYRFQVDIPMKTVEGSKYWSYDAGVVTTAPDNGYFTYVNSSGATVNQFPFNSMVYVQGPLIGASAYASIRDRAGTDTSSVAAAGDYTFVDDHGVNMTGQGTLATGTLVGTETFSSCALSVEPTVSSVYAGAATIPASAVRTDVTRPDLGPDGVACTADDVSGWVVKYTLDVPSGKTVVRIEAKSNFTVAPWAASGTTIVNKSETTYTGTDGVVRSSSSTAQATVTRVANVGQMKSRYYDRRQVGSSIGWTSSYWNTTASPISGAEYVDVLPYEGDGRGTTFTLNNVKLDPNNLPAGSRLYVTTAPGSTVPRDVTDPLVDPSNTAMWCVWGSAGCASTGEITAYYLVAPDVPADYAFTVDITADTKGSVDGDVAVNSLGKGYVQSMAIEIAPGINYPTTLYLNTLSGYVYADTDRNHAKEGTEKGLTGYTVELLDAMGVVLATTTSDANGYYVFKDLPDGVVATRVTLRSAEESTTQAGASTTNGVTTTPQIQMYDFDPTNVNFGVVLPEKIQITKTADKASYVPGEVIKYTITVTAPSTNGSLLYTTVTDNNCVNLALRSGGNPLSAGRTATYTCTHTVTQADWQAGSYNNTATVTTDDRSTATPTDPSASASVSSPIVANPALDVTKTVDKATASVGDTLTYTLTYKNTGDVTLPGFNLVDNQCTSFTGSTYVSSLAPNASYSVKCSHLVTAADAAAGSYNNTASGTVTYYGTTVTDSASVSTTIQAKHDLTIVKNSQSGTRLTGAVFELRAADGTKATTTANPDGTLSIKGVAEGTYDLVETKAPAGAQLLAQPLKVVVNSTGVDVSQASGAGSVVTASGYTVTVVDQTGVTTMPGTGGQGASAVALSALFVLAIATGYGLRTRRRRA